MDVAGGGAELSAQIPIANVHDHGIRLGAMTDAIAGLKSSPDLPAIYQVHNNLRPGEAHNNTDDGFIANFGDDPNACTAHLITMSVAPDAKSYTVRIPARGHAKTFRTKAKS